MLYLTVTRFGSGIWLKLMPVQILLSRATVFIPSLIYPPPVIVEQFRFRLEFKLATTDPSTETFFRLNAEFDVALRSS